MCLSGWEYFGLFFKEDLSRKACYAGEQIGSHKNIVSFLTMTVLLANVYPIPYAFQNADVNVQDIHERTPLLLASSKGGWRTVHFLLQNKADINIKDKEKRNFLHLAIKYGSTIDKFGCEVIRVTYYSHNSYSDDDKLSLELLFVNQSVSITKTRLYNSDPLKPHSYIVHYFFYFCAKT